MPPINYLYILVGIILFIVLSGISTRRSSGISAIRSKIHILHDFQEPYFHDFKQVKLSKINGLPNEPKPEKYIIYTATEPDGQIGEWICTDTKSSPPIWSKIGYVDITKYNKESHEEVH